MPEQLTSIYCCVKIAATASATVSHCLGNGHYLSESESERQFVQTKPAKAVIITK